MQALLKEHHRKAFTLADQAVVSGSNFLLTIILTRALGLEQYGSFALIWIVVLFNLSMHQSLIGLPLINFGTNTQGKESEKFFSNMFSFHLVYAVAAALLTSLFVWLLGMTFPKWELNELCLLIPLCTFFFLNHEYFRKRFFTKSQPNKALILDAIAYLPQVISFTILGVINSLSVHLALIIVSVSFLLSSLFGLWSHSKVTFSLNNVIPIIRNQWNFSRWLLSSSILHWLTGNLFLVAVGATIGTSAVGAIKIIQNLMGVLNVFFITLENYVPVSAVKLFAVEGRKSLITYLSRVSVKGMIFTFLVVSLLAVFSEPIIRFVYGEMYLEYKELIYGFGVIYLIVFIVLILQIAIRTLQSTKDIFISQVISAIFCILIASPVVHLFGIQGVIIGMAISQIVKGAWYIFSINRLKTKL
jgi:O-antigen/teichoic acid export membrane protein